MAGDLGWLEGLNGDPIPTLLAWEDAALNYYVQRDLLDAPVPPIESLWELPTVQRLISKQQPDGSWRYPGKTIDPEVGTNYFLLETYRTLRTLVEIYGLDKSHSGIEKVCEYIFSCQTGEADIRGIIGNQYMPYYHGAILELLIKAGFEEDQRLIRGLDWLLSMRQDDGGWIVPAQLVPFQQKSGEFWLGDPLPPDRSHPHAHLATGMVLRSFAVHPSYLNRPEIIAAANCLKSRLFKPDRYNDRKATSYWLKFQFPFWWTSLLTALDTLGRLGFSSEDLQIASGLEWFISNQGADGLWGTGYGEGGRAEENRHWVGLAVCRVLKMFFRKEGIQPGG